MFALESEKMVIFFQLPKKKQSGGQTRQNQRQQNWNPAKNEGEKTVFAKQVIEIRELREENGNQLNKQRATLGNEEREEIEKRETVAAFSRKTPSSGFFVAPYSPPALRKTHKPHHCGSGQPCIEA